MRARCAVRGARGITLFELLIVLTVLGLILAVSGLAVGSLQVPRESARVIALRHARAAAIHSGARRTAHGALFLPDGRVIGAGVDQLTGVPHAK